LTIAAAGVCWRCRTWQQIVRQPLIIALLAVPIIIQVYLNAGIAYAVNRALGVPHNVACPSAFHPRGTMRTTESITGTSTSTPTTVASAAPD
jgi:ACR3 family arsenite efflux pump ArsB